ncbi:MAG: fibronectin type III domain-containing protein [Coriobacteriales bacterium]
MNISPIGSDEEFFQMLPTGFGAQEDSSLNTRSVQGRQGSPTPRAGALPCGTPSVNSSLNTAVAPAHKSTRSASTAASSSASAAVTRYELGDTRSFYDYDAKGLVPAELVAQGDSYTLWIETASKQLLPQSSVDSLAAQLDGLVSSANEFFGAPEGFDIDNDGKVAFLLQNIDDYSGGYFWAGDLYGELTAGAPADMLHLNICNVTHADGTLGFDEGVALSTAAHEYQHLLNYVYTLGYNDAWINEVFSQAAVFATRTEADYFRGFSTGYGQVLAQRAMTAPLVFEGDYVPWMDPSENAASGAAYYQWGLFSQYLHNQTRAYCQGSNFFKLYLEDCARDIDQGEDQESRPAKERIERVLRSIGYLGSAAGCQVGSVDELLMNFNTALIARAESGVFSLTNQPGTNPSQLGSIEVPLFASDALTVDELYGGAAMAHKATLLDQAPLPGATSCSVTPLQRDGNVLRWTLTAPCYNSACFSFSPGDQGAQLKDGDTVSIAFAEEQGAFEYALQDANRKLLGSYQLYTGPIELPEQAVRIVVRAVYSTGTGGLVFSPLYEHVRAGVQPTQASVGAVKNAKVKRAGSGKLSVSWRAVKGAKSYRVYFKRVGAKKGGRVTVAAGSAKAGITVTRTLSGLSAGARYKVRITAFSKARERGSVLARSAWLTSATVR